MRLWNKQVVTAYNANAGANQSIEALVTPVCPGLAIHRSLYKRDNKRKWILTHTSSGKTAGVADDKRSAMRALLILGTQNIDWTLNADQLCTRYCRLQVKVNAAIAEGSLADPKQKIFSFRDVTAVVKNFGYVVNQYCNVFTNPIYGIPQ